MTQTAKVVVDTILAVVRLRAPDAGDVRLDQQLADDLHLASLDLAELGARIEVELGQPVFDGVAMQGFVTVGDLVAHCEEVMAGVGA
jgi:acyl carrier protein